MVNSCASGQGECQCTDTGEIGNCSEITCEGSCTVNNVQYDVGQKFFSPNGCQECSCEYGSSSTGDEIDVQCSAIFTSDCEWVRTDPDLDTESSGCTLAACEEGITIRVVTQNGSTVFPANIPYSLQWTQGNCSGKVEPADMQGMGEVFPESDTVIKFSIDRRVPGCGDLSTKKESMTVQFLADGVAASDAVSFIPEWEFRFCNSCWGKFPDMVRIVKDAVSILAYDIQK